MLTGTNNGRPTQTSSNRGAASVLVIIMMIVLIIFGTLAFVTSNFNAKLGQRSLEWRVNYYQMEDQAEDWLRNTDALLLQAELRTREYIAQGAFRGDTRNLSPEARLPSDAQREIETAWDQIAQQEAGRDVFFQNWFSRLYYYHAVTLLEEYTAREESWALMLAEGFDVTQLLQPDSVWNKRRLTGELVYITNSLTSQSDPLKHIDITMLLTLPEYTFTYSPAGQVSGLRHDTPLSRYVILQWQQWQEIESQLDDPMFDGTLSHDHDPAQGDE